jgi:hypothetical protein
MKRIIRCLTIVLLASDFGLACGDSFSAQATGRDEVSLTREAPPQIDLDHEATLRKELLRLREALEQYATEHAKGLPTPATRCPGGGRVPPGLPIDPVTGRRDW